MGKKAHRARRATANVTTGDTVVRDTVVMAWISPGQVSHYFTESMFATGLVGAREGWLTNVLTDWSSANVSASRNKLTQQFLDNGVGDWLLWVDADMQWDAETDIQTLLAVADPKDRPIVGGLCFGMSSDGMYPTLYMGHTLDDGRFTTIRIRDYPRDSLVRCAATGAAFLLIHRTVLEAMAAKGFDPAFPFFAESSGNGKAVGEDITFCIRAGLVGAPVFVHTGVRIGHHKSILLTEAEFDKQLPAGCPPDVGLVIPTRGDHPDLLRAIIATSGLPPERVVVVANGPDLAGVDVPGATVIADTGDINIHRWWNAGIDLLAERGCTRVAVLNDDVVIAPDTLPRLARGLGGATLAWVGDELNSGHAFMLNTTHSVRCDESFRWWCGDLQLWADAEAAHGAVRVPEAWVLHMHPNEATDASGALTALAKADGSLYDTRHPQGSPHHRLEGTPHA